MMTGFEDLTSDQLMIIVQLITFAILFFTTGQIIRSLIDLKISKNIKLRVEKELLEEVRNQSSKPPFFKKLKLWWAKRKVEKELCEPFKPIKWRD